MCVINHWSSQFRCLQVAACSYRQTPLNQYLAVHTNNIDARSITEYTLSNNCIISLYVTIIARLIILKKMLLCELLLPKASTSLVRFISMRCFQWQGKFPALKKKLRDRWVYQSSSPIPFVFQACAHIGTQIWKFLADWEWWRRSSEIYFFYHASAGWWGMPFWNITEKFKT